MQTIGKALQIILVSLVIAIAYSCANNAPSLVFCRQCFLFVVGVAYLANNPLMHTSEINEAYLSVEEDYGEWAGRALARSEQWLALTEFDGRAVVESDVWMVDVQQAESVGSEGETTDYSSPFLFVASVYLLGACAKSTLPQRHASVANEGNRTTYSSGKPAELFEGDVQQAESVGSEGETTDYSLPFLFVASIYLLGACAKSTLPQRHASVANEGNRTTYSLGKPSDFFEGNGALLCRSNSSPAVMQSQVPDNSTEGLATKAFLCRWNSGSLIRKSSNCVRHMSKLLIESDLLIGSFAQSR
jgi:hypothetical protein